MSDRSGHRRGVDASTRGSSSASSSSRLVVFAALNLVYALLVEAISADDDGAAVTLGILGARDRGDRHDVAAGRVRLRRAGRARRDVRRDASARSSRASRARSSRCSLAGLLAGLGIALGFLLLVAPGSVPAHDLGVIAPVIVVEKRRALELVRPLARARARARLDGLRDRAHHRSPLGRSRAALLQAAFSFLPRFLEILVGATIAQAVVAPFSAIAIAITYFRLRDAHGDAAGASSA